MILTHNRIHDVILPYFRYGFMQYNVTCLYIIQNHEHMDRLHFAKQNIPGAENSAPGIGITLMI